MISSCKNNSEMEIKMFMKHLESGNKLTELKEFNISEKICVF